MPSYSHEPDSHSASLLDRVGLRAERVFVSFVTMAFLGAEMPDLSDFTPSLIPEPARPLVLAQILLVKNFGRAVVWVVLAVLVLLGVIFGTIPAQISTFGIFAEIFLTLLCAVVLTLLINMVYVKGNEQVDMLELLEDFCAGEVTAAFEVTRIIAAKTAGATGNTARALAVCVMNFNAGDALASDTGAVVDAAGAAANATGNAAKAVGGAAEDGAKATAAFAGSVVGGAFSMVKDPSAGVLNAAGAVGDAAGSTLEAGGSAVSNATEAAGNAINAAMEMNPLLAFEKIIKMVLEVCWWLVVLTPPVLIIAGWIVWKLGIQLSGLELIAFGVGFAILGGLGWWSVNVTAEKQLSNAGVQIIRMQMKSAGAAVGLAEGMEAGSKCVSVPLADCNCVSMPLLEEPLL